MDEASHATVIKLEALPFKVGFLKIPILVEYRGGQANTVAITDSLEAVNQHIVSLIDQQKLAWSTWL